MLTELSRLMALGGTGKAMGTETGFADAIAATVDTKAPIALVAAQTNDDMQAILLSRRKTGVPGGLGDSRAIRAAVQANVREQVIAHVAEIVAGIGG